MQDLRLFTQKPAKLVTHPLYDNFGEKVEKLAARQHLGLPENKQIILFFGFIRKYKGLDLLLEAIALLKNRPEPTLQNLQLLVAGEFYEDRKTYEELIARLSIAPWLIMRTDFINDSEVKYYLSAADFVIQPYRNATQSGVTPLAYHFEKPMLVTNVGGLPALVPNKVSGLVCEADAPSLAEHIVQLYKLGEEYFLPGLKEEKKKYSWDVLVNTIKELSLQVTHTA
jgi:glycosyltransferase involved in cell wall biosynthesis